MLEIDIKEVWEKVFQQKSMGENICVGLLIRIKRVALNESMRE